MLVAGVVATGLVSFYVRTNVALEQNVLLGVDMIPRVRTWGVAAWLLVSGVVFWGPQVRSRLGKALIAVGNGSYSICLTSAVSTEMISRLIARIPIEGLRNGPFPVRAGTVFVFVIVTGMVCFWFVETPLLKWLNSRYTSISRRRLAPATPVVEV